MVVGGCNRPDKKSGRLPSLLDRGVEPLRLAFHKYDRVSKPDHSTFPCLAKQ